MASISRQVSGAFRAAGLVYKREFGKIPVEDRELTLNGDAYVDSNGLVIPDTSGDFATEENIDPGPFTAPMVISVRFTPNFAATEAVSRSVLSVRGPTKYIALQRNFGGRMYLTVGSVTVLNVAAASWQPYWLEDQENVLTVFFKSANNTAWLNGTEILTAANVFNHEVYERINFGAYDSGVQTFKGVIHSVDVYNVEEPTDLDIPRIEARDIISQLEPAKAQIYIPCRGNYVRASDSKTVTKSYGQAEVAEVLLGEDGLTSSKFPSDVLPRGFLYDGDDRLTASDNDAFSFTEGGTDLAFSIGCLIQPTAPGTLIDKSDGLVNQGEYVFYTQATGTGLRIIFLVIDETEVKYIGRFSSAAVIQLNCECSVIATYDGSGLIGGIAVYVDGIRVDDSNFTNGTYVRMRNTTKDLVFGRTHDGEMREPFTMRGALSPLQVRAQDWLMKNRSYRR